jgi:hypothetical protein
MEMDPEMAAAMANNHIFKGIAGADDSSEEDEEEYGAELRAAQKHQ